MTICLNWEKTREILFFPGIFPGKSFSYLKEERAKVNRIAPKIAEVPGKSGEYTVLPDFPGNISYLPCKSKTGIDCRFKQLLELDLLDYEW